MNSLNFSRQYIIGPKYIDEFDDWNKLEIGNNSYATIHPNLEFSQSINMAQTLTLFGYLIDPYNPNLSNQEILNGINERITKFDDLIDELYCLSGRWVIVYSSENEFKIVNDLVGFREVFYTFHNETFWCGSDPKILAHNLSLKKTSDRDVLIYQKSNYFKKRENAWYGNKTLYENVFHLLPNHVLDVFNEKTYRYWLNKETPKDVEAVAIEVGNLLRASLVAANKRYKIMLGITAGLDSRVLLAASKDISQDIYYFVSKMDLDEKHVDIQIPSKLLPKLDLKLNIFESNQEVRKEIEELLENNILLHRKNPRNKALQYYLDYVPERINVNGVVNEVARGFYGFNHPNNQDLTSEYFINMLGYYGESNLIKREIKEWLDSIRSSSLNIDFSYVDLFYWEQRMGNWGSITRNEQDIANEGFMPYNNRKIIMLLSSLAPEYRAAPNYVVYKLIIKNLWPETLQEPINPETLKEKIYKWILGITPKAVKNSIKILIQK